MLNILSVKSVMNKSIIKKAALPVPSSYNYLIMTKCDIITNLPVNYPVSNLCVQIVYCEYIVRHPRPAEPSLGIFSFLIHGKV